MIPPGSRYEDGERLWTQAYVYDRYQEPVYEEDTAYSERVLDNREAVMRFRTLPLPERPEGEYFAKDSEDMQFLSFLFMEDSNKWWQLAEVNPQIWYPLDIKAGDPIRVLGT